MIEVPSNRVEAARRIAGLFLEAHSLAVATHVGGDGDGWGSACALAHHFGLLGKDVRLLAASPYPDRYRFLLPRDEEPRVPDGAGAQAARSADLQVVVDASELTRIGDFASYYRPERTIVIDHHPIVDGTMDAAHSLIDPGAAATVELVYDVLSQTERPLVPATALAIYVGLVTDTGSFRYSNTVPRTHRLAADLLETGVDPEYVYGRLYGTVTVDELKVLQAALENVEQDAAHPLTWSVLRAELMDRHREPDDYERVMEHVRNVAGTEIAALFRETSRDAVKVSLRSNGPADVSTIARRFGGGGHHKAAGAVIREGLEDVKRDVLDACREVLETP